MCGIAGSLTWVTASAPSLETFDIERLAYRGPDALRIADSGDASCPPHGVRWRLAHARLSIIDLAAAANQPMVSADGRYWIVFNGEIYNHRDLRAELERLGHRFRTDHSDTETLLYAYVQWGRGCLARLNGMFAFVVIDNQMGRMFAARDRLGIKPFYFRHADGVFTFASEPKAILGPRAVARRELLNYFTFLQVAGPATFYEGINKLPAAHLIEFDGSGVPTPERYWHPLVGACSGRDLADAGSCIALLQDAVDLQMVADVEVGTYLSGGLDSAVITALASRGRSVNTFSIGFENGLPGYANELPYARLVARHVHARHHELVVSPADYLAAQQRVFRILDEPIANDACGPLLLLSEKARAEGVTVCLSGEGSDELFVGYRHWHDAFRVNRAVRAVPRWLLAAYLGLGAPGLAARRPDVVTWIRRAAADRHVIWGGNDALCRVAEGQIFAPQFLADCAQPYDTVSAFMDLPENKHADLLQRLSAFDLQFRLPENLLARVDRMSMAASLEARVPYLDHRLVEQAMRIPTRLLVSDKGEKIALKEFAERILPREIVHRPKVGFTIPLHAVLDTREARRQSDLILAMDDELRIYADQFRRQLAAGEVTGTALWPHFALANWWALHVRT